MRDFIENLQQVSINKMIAEYLKNNIHKFDDSIHFEIIRKPNLEDFTENQIRWNLFNQFWLFNRFIPHCDWYECDLLFPECLEHIKIICEASWFSNPKEHDRLVSKLNVNKIPDTNHNLKIIEFLENGIEHFINNKRLILIGKYNEDTLTLLDGNHRFVALNEAFKQNRFERLNIKIIVGLTYGNCRWIGDDEKWEERPSQGNEKRYVLNIW